MSRIKRIHVNQHRIRRNIREEERQPVIAVKCGKQNIYGFDAFIEGDSVVRYRPDNPLNCGARLWIETHAMVVVDTGDEMVTVE